MHISASPAHDKPCKRIKKVACPILLCRQQLQPVKPLSLDNKEVKSSMPKRLLGTTTCRRFGLPYAALKVITGFIHQETPTTFLC